MAILTNLFGESPFGALEAHGEKVHECVGLLKEAFAAAQAADQKRSAEIAARISTAETEADKIRNHIHEMLGSRVLLPMNREQFFDLLEQQDSIADRAEDISATLTYREMQLPEDVLADLNTFLETVFKNCQLAQSVMSKLDILVEGSFAGRDALTVSKLITELSEREDMVKRQQIVLTQKLFSAEDRLSPLKAVLWLQIIAYAADLSKCADRTANGIRLTLKLKPLKD